MIQRILYILSLMVITLSVSAQGMAIKTLLPEYKTTDFITITIFTVEEYVIPTDGACNPAVLFSYQKLENGEWKEIFSYKPKSTMDCGVASFKCNGQCSFVLRQRIETPGIYRVNIDDINGQPYYSKGFEVKEEKN